MSSGPGARDGNSTPWDVSFWEFCARYSNVRFGNEWHLSPEQMNAMLASGGYPWTVIRVEDRNPYLAALDRASIHLDIRPFAVFIAERVKWSLKSSLLITDAVVEATRH